MTESEEKQQANTVVMLINIDCHGCCRKVFKAFENVEGMREMAIDQPQNKVIVKGSVEPEKLMKRLARKTGKRVQLLKVEKTLESSEDDGRSHDNCLPAEIQTTGQKQEDSCPNNSVFFSEEEMSCSIM